MPKAPRTRKATVTSNGNAHPYPRGKASSPATLVSTDAPSTPASEDDKSKSAKRRRRKGRTDHKDGEVADNVNDVAMDEEPNQAMNGLTTHKEEGPTNTSVRRRQSASPIKNVVASEPVPPENLSKDHKKAEKAMLAKMKKVQAEADKAAADLAEKKRQVEELEMQLEEKKAELDGHKSELEAKVKLITAHDSHTESVKEAVTCNVCFETLSDPHVLSCGHGACRKCLVQWFRSANAYSNEDITEIGDDDDMRYRTKLCHMCRKPVYDRPVRSFVLSAVIETAGIRDLTASAPEPAVGDVWDKMFPPARESYTIADVEDSMARCPNCTGEITHGECVMCGAGPFSDDEASDDDEASIATDDINDVLTDDDDDHPMYNGLRNALEAQNRGPLGDEPHLLAMIDDIADESGEERLYSDEEEDEEDEDEGTGLDTDWSGGESDPSSERIRLENILRRGRHDNPVREHVSDVESYDEDYESSFIDDDNDAEDAAYGRRLGLLGGDASSDDEASRVRVGGRGTGNTTVIELEDSSDEDQVEEDAGGESEADEPTIDELRARRANRYGRNESSPVAAPARPSRRRRVIDSDSE